MIYYLKMKTVVIALIILYMAYASQDFKETEKKESKGPGIPPNIVIPENLRLKVNVSETFNIALGLDMVLVKM